MRPLLLSLVLLLALCGVAGADTLGYTVSSTIFSFPQAWNLWVLAPQAAPGSGEQTLRYCSMDVGGYNGNTVSAKLAAYNHDNADHIVAEGTLKTTTVIGERGISWTNADLTWTPANNGGHSAFVGGTNYILSVDWNTGTADGEWGYTNGSSGDTKYKAADYHTGMPDPLPSTGYTTYSKRMTLYCVMGSPANHYIRSGASGTGTGADHTNAFTTFLAAQPFIRGDTYYLDAGSYPAFDMRNAAVGTSLASFKKATVADHGTDIGWDASYAAAAAIDGPVRFFSSYVNFDCVTGGGPGSWTSGFGCSIAVPTGTPYAAIQLSDASATTNAKTAPTHIDLWHIDASHVTPVDNDDGIFYTTGCLSGCGNIGLHYMYIHNSNDNLLYIDNMNPFLLEYSYITGLAAYGTRHRTATRFDYSSNVTIRYNIYADITTWYTTGILGAYDGPPAMVGLYVYGNIFFGNTTTPDGGGTTIYQNHMTVPSQYSSWYIYNNTFHSLSATNNPITTQEPNYNFADAHAWNNLWYRITDNTTTNCGVLRNTIAYPTGMDAAYNHYESSCLHGAETGAQDESGDPLVNVDAGNFALKNNTQPGYNLGPPYNVDMLGNVRSTWSMGALEYQSTSKPVLVIKGP